jgi:hypothetical protein
VGYLETWAKSSGTRPTLQAITRKAAGNFVGSLVAVETAKAEASPIGL